MKLGAEDKKKAVIAGVVGVLALGALIYLYSMFFGGTTAPPQQAPIIVDNTHPTTGSTPGIPTKVATAPPGFAVAGAAEKVGTTSGQLDPTLHEEAMLNTESLIYSGTGRNIFSGISEAPVLKKAALPIPVTGPRNQTFIPPPQAVNPCPPVCPPPPINLKFFGTSTSASGVRKAFLLGGDDVFLAAQGDIVQRKYRVISISAGTILIEDIPNTNKQSLSLIPN